MKTMVVNTRQPYPLPWDPYGYRAVIFTLGIPSRLERVFYYQVPQESSSTRFVVKSSLTGLTLSNTQLPDLSSEAVTMAKRMQDKESIAGMSWLVLLIIACWGGLVRYLIDVKQSKATWSLINALAQMVVSGFTGVIAGLVSIESGLSIYMILATSGISGAMGSVALTYFWERITGVKAP